MPTLKTHQEIARALVHLIGLGYLAHTQGPVLQEHEGAAPSVIEFNDGTGMGLEIGPANRNDESLRIMIRGIFPAMFEPRYESEKAECRICVDRNKDASKIYHEIQRRLLPAYKTHYVPLKKASDEREKKRQASSEAMSKIAALIGSKKHFPSSRGIRVDIPADHSAIGRIASYAENEYAIRIEISNVNLEAAVEMMAAYTRVMGSKSAT